MKVQCLAVFSNHFTFYWWSTQNVAFLLLSSNELMSCCAAVTNGFLNLRLHAFPPDVQVSAELSRYPGSMARCARDSVAPLKWSSPGWMPARIGRLSTSRGCRHPVTACKASLMTTSLRRVWALQHQTGSAVLCCWMDQD